MYLVIDPRDQRRLFCHHDPRPDGFVGEVEENVRYEEVENVHDWPDGAAAPEPFLGRSKTDPKHYVAFRFRRECNDAGFEPIGEHFGVVMMRWSEYRGPSTIEFADRHSVVFDRECVTFPSEVDGQRVICEISLETLIRDHGARRPSDLESAFVASKELIRKRAKNLIAAGKVRDGKLIMR